jgi:hypothetical protein
MSSIKNILQYFKVMSDSLNVDKTNFEKVSSSREDTTATSAEGKLLQNPISGHLILNINSQASQ